MINKIKVENADVESPILLTDDDSSPTLRWLQYDYYGKELMTQKIVPD
jgi:hypothetical protein